MTKDGNNINLYHRIDADLDDWTEELEKIRSLITQGEISYDGDEFQDARRKIAGLLDQMGQTRQFIAFKQTQETVEEIVADVEGAFANPANLFVDDLLDGPLDEHLLDESGLE